MLNMDSYSELQCKIEENDSNMFKKQFQIGARYFQKKVWGMQQLQNSNIIPSKFNVKNYSRSLQLTFVNLTQQALYIANEYFCSGKWHQPWPQLKPYTVSHGLMVNTPLTGISGGLGLKIKSDKDEVKNLTILFGFSNPLQGCYKHFIAFFPDNRLKSDGPKTGEIAYNNINDQDSKYQKCGYYQIRCFSTQSPLAQRAYVLTINRC